MDQIKYIEEKKQASLKRKASAANPPLMPAVVRAKAPRVLGAMGAGTSGTSKSPPVVSNGAGGGVRPNLTSAGPGLLRGCGKVAPIGGGGARPRFRFRAAVPQTSPSPAAAPPVEAQTSPSPGPPAVQQSSPSPAPSVPEAQTAAAPGGPAVQQTSSSSASAPAASSTAPPPARAVDLNCVNVDVEDYLADQKNANSKAAEDYVVRLFNQTFISLNQIGVVRKDGTPWKQLEDCSRLELAEHLAKFPTAAVKKDGSYYSSSTINALWLSMVRYLKHRKSDPFDVHLHPEFLKSKAAFIVSTA